MKIVKSLLLGTAAGFIAAAAAPAADLENDVKAPRSAESVKVCSLYGEGFYQIPGEGDICIRIGATARLDGGINADGNGVRSSAPRGFAQQSRRQQRLLVPRSRHAVVGARQMTQYGVLKGLFQRRL